MVTSVLIIGTVLLVLAVLIAVLLVSRLITVAGPQEVLVVAGRRHLVDGKALGYRVLLPNSRVVRIPVIETVHHLDLTPIPIELAIDTVYTRDNVPVDIAGTAEVAIAPTPPILQNAVERFLGRPRTEIGVVASETLEGVLRSQMAALTVEEVTHDPHGLAEAIRSESEEDLDKLGLRLERLAFARIDVPEGVARPRSASSIESPAAL